MPGSPLPRRGCESRPLLRVGFALGVPQSARSRRNGLQTSEGYKVGGLDPLWVPRPPRASPLGVPSAAAGP